MKIVQVVPSPAQETGGPAYSVPSLAYGLAARGAQVVVRCVGEPSSSGSSNGTSEIEITAHAGQIHFPADRLYASSALKTVLYQDAITCSILHAHGLWLLPNAYPAWAARRPGAEARAVHSPRGMLSEAALRFSPLKKRAAWALFQRSAVLGAACLHATAMSEYEEIRAFGLSNPVAVIPNGIDLPNLASLPKAEVEPNSPRTVLLLGRVHPKKGLDRLIRAWAQIETRHPNWLLRIVGPSERGYGQELKNLALSLCLTSVSFEAPLYGPEKFELLQMADVFVLPTLNENFGIVVAEALAAKTPVISTKGAPWPGLETHRCGWWIDHGIEPLVAALESALSLPANERVAMGLRGRTWVARDFSWDSIACEMLQVYRWLVDGGDPPEMVRLR